MNENEHTGNNKRIAKNIAFLYIRMLFNMVITFYTSRVVLNTLGVDDFQRLWRSWYDYCCFTQLIINFY